MDAINGATKPRKRKVGWMDWFLESTPVGRGILFDKARGRGRGRARARVGAGVGVTLTLTLTLTLTPTLLCDQAGKTVAKQTKGKYPAPVAILKCAKAGMESGHTKGSEIERQQFGVLAATSAP